MKRLCKEGIFVPQLRVAAQIKKMWADELIANCSINKPIYGPFVLSRKTCERQFVIKVSKITEAVGAFITLII